LALPAIANESTTFFLKHKPNNSITKILQHRKASGKACNFDNSASFFLLCMISSDFLLCAFLTHFDGSAT